MIDVALGGLAGLLAVLGAATYLLGFVLSERGQALDFPVAVAVICGAPVVALVGVFVGARFASTIAPRRLSGRGATFAAGVLGGLLGVAASNIILGTHAMLTLGAGREAMDTAGAAGVTLGLAAAVGLTAVEWVIPVGVATGVVMAILPRASSMVWRLLTWVGVSVALMTMMRLVSGQLPEGVTLLGSDEAYVLMISVVGGLVAGLVAMWFEDRW